MKRSGMAALLAGFGIALAVPSSVCAQAVPTYNETPSDALARNVRILTNSPRDFDALVGAGKAALQTGDPQAAAGFFGRAADVNPNSPIPQAGMGAALVASGDAAASLTYFGRAQQLGGSVAGFGADRGLAYDLLGNQAAAQSDYRAALYGSDRDDARRRLALSLAISGQKEQALTMLQPLLQQRDPAAQRARAFILALNGDMAAARSALDYMMPGASARMAPFFKRLPQLASAQKAAAVHLGIFPETDQPDAVTIAGSRVVAASVPSNGGDRLASIEQLLAQQQDTTPPASATRPPAVPAHVSRTYSPAVSQVTTQPKRIQLASVSRPAIQRASPNNDLIQTARVSADPDAPKIWLQLASASSPTGFRQQFHKIRSRDPSLFHGINGFVAQDRSKSRLVIGPFHSQQDARLFSEALQSANIDSYNWTSEPGQQVIRLPQQ